QWWQTAHDRYALVVSRAVLGEVSAGNPKVAAQRLDKLAGLPILPPVPETEELALKYNGELQFPPAVSADLLHLAYCVVYELNYLVMWNCAHLANPHIIRR